MLSSDENIDKIEDIEKKEEIELQQKSKVKIVDLAAFKSNLELYPIVKPFINIDPKGAKSKL